MYNDHIAFSTAVAVSVAWIVYYLPSIPVRWERIALGILAAFFGVYLHVLAAKTGLIALYIFLFGLIIHQSRRNLKMGMLFFILLIASFMAAVALVPTLRERLTYSYVTWRSYRMGERHGIYSDANRIISYNVALRSIAAHPLAGSGAGDVLHDMRDGYQKWYPEVPAEEVLWPHNQWLTCAMAAGIPAALLFTLWLVAPLRRIKRGREGAFFLIVWTMLLVPLMVDPFLEVQFGVAVFLIFLLMQKKQLAN
jgi:O-antigen ligase